MRSKLFRKHGSKIRSSVARDLKAIRADGKLTQQKFAHDVGISVGALQKYEQRQSTISVEVAYEIDRKFGVYVLDLERLEAREKITSVEPHKPLETAPKATLLRRCIAGRRQVIDSYTAFLNERHTDKEKKWVAVHGNAFMLATLCFALSRQKMDWLSSANPNQGSIDWLLLISFAAVALTASLEIVHMFRFWRWRQRVA